MTPFFDLTFWGQVLDHADEHSQKMLGIGKTITDGSGKNINTITLDDQPNGIIRAYTKDGGDPREDADTDPATAGQMFALLKHVETDLDAIKLPTRREYSDVPPEQINMPPTAAM